MRKRIGMATLLVVVAALRAGAEQAKPEKPAAPQAAVQAEAPLTERELLREILDELRGMRSDIRSLQRSLQPPRPPAPSPPPLPSSLKLGVGATLGNGDAKVAVIEFSEFQCPYCKRYYDQSFSKLKESYIDSGKVRYEFRDFPLGMHPQARPAALAARCAGEQGAFWKMREELFKAQGSLGPELYDRLAKDLGLDDERFRKCLADAKQDQALSEEIVSAEALGVRGTPHFLLGQVKDGNLVGLRALSGAQPFESFRAAIDALLVAPVGPAPAPRR